jgi:asparagine synthase (glutamine-hydrolysing)
MSGIVGIWNLRGQPVEKQLLQRLNATLRHRGSDGDEVWCQGTIGLACQNYWITPESEKEVQPKQHPKGMVLVFDGRLDNREEILAGLKDFRDVSPSSSDADLILATYLAFGERLSERLVGDYALALFDPHKKQLLLIRDALGVKPLYYCHTGDLFLFASEVKALLAHPQVSTTPNENLLADFLLDRIHDPELTFFNGISSLPPAHAVLVSPKRFKKWRYWDFDPSKTIRLGSYQEYGEAFRDIFERCVKRRLRSAFPVAVSVSGGLDSSSVFCQAKALTRRTAGLCPDVFGVSSVFPEGTPADEQIFLSYMESSYGSTIHRIPFERLGLLDHSEEEISQIEVPFLDEMWGDTRRIMETAHRFGARVLLTGHWGDQFLFSQTYLVDLWRHLRWIQVRSHLAEFGRWLTDVEPKWFYRRFFVDLAKFHLPARLLPSLRRLRRTSAGPWYTEAFRQRARQRLRTRPFTGGRFPTVYSRSVYEEARAGYHVFCMEWNNKVAAMHGLEMTFPFLDRDLIAFMMSVPGEIHAWKGVPKALLRAAMIGIVPGAILDRHDKSDFTHLVNEALEEDYDQLIQHLRPDGHASQRGYLNGKVFEESMLSLKKGLNGSDCQSAWVLWDLLSLELWLQRFFGKTNGEKEVTTKWEGTTKTSLDVEG